MSLFGRATVPPEVQAREDAWNRDKEACLKRFNEAVAARKRGSYGLSQAIIAAVKESHGQKAADVAALEIKKAIQREPKTKR